MIVISGVGKEKLCYCFCSPQWHHLGCAVSPLWTSPLHVMFTGQSNVCVLVRAWVAYVCECVRERVCVCVCVCVCMYECVAHVCVCVCVCDVGKKFTCTSRYKNIKSTLFLSLKNILPCFWLWGCVVKITPTTHHPEVPCAVNRMLKYYCGQYRLHMFALCFEGWQNSPLGLPGQ